MGLRHSKKSVDIQATAKKNGSEPATEIKVKEISEDAPTTPQKTAAPQEATETTTIILEGEAVASINGEEEESKVAGEEKPANGDAGDHGQVQDKNESNKEETEKKEEEDKKEKKVKKKKSFRSFSFLRREKKVTKQENVNGEVNKEEVKNEGEQKEVVASPEKIEENASAAVSTPTNNQDDKKEELPVTLDEAMQAETLPAVQDNSAETIVADLKAQPIEGEEKTTAAYESTQSFTLETGQKTTSEVVEETIAISEAPAPISSRPQPQSEEVTVSNEVPILEAPAIVEAAPVVNASPILEVISSDEVAPVVDEVVSPQVVSLQEDIIQSDKLSAEVANLLVENGLVEELLNKEVEAPLLNSLPHVEELRSQEIENFSQEKASIPEMTNATDAIKVEKSIVLEEADSSSLPSLNNESTQQNSDFGFDKTEE